MSTEMLSEAEIAARLIAAVGFGALVGLERGYQQHRAGLRTHMLIALAAALFTIVSSEGFAHGDPARVSAQIVSGVGFLGAGAILQLKAGTRGLTTAASIWVAAGPWHGRWSGPVSHWRGSWRPRFGGPNADAARQQVPRGPRYQEAPH